VFMDQEWWTNDDPSKILAISTEIVMWDGRRERCLQTRGDFRFTAEVYETIRVYFKDGKPEKPRWVKDAYVRKQSTLSREQGKTVGVEVQGGNLVP